MNFFSVDIEILRKNNNKNLNLSHDKGCKISNSDDYYIYHHIPVGDNNESKKIN